MMIRNYRELSRLKTFEDRYNYLRLDGEVGQSTFGYDRYLNQILYKSGIWRQTRDIVIIRDQGCDLGDLDYEIKGRLYVHHMNPITIEDIKNREEKVFDPEFLVCCSHNTHNAITYGNESLLPQMPIERRRNDTCPWI